MVLEMGELSETMHTECGDPQPSISIWLPKHWWPA